MSPRRADTDEAPQGTLAPVDDAAWSWGLLDSLPDAVIITDRAHKVRGWNRRATELYGYTPEATLGADIFSITPFERPSTLAEHLQERLALGDSRDLGDYIYDDLGRGVAAIGLSAEPLEGGAGAREDLGLLVAVHEPLQSELELGELRGRVERKRALLETLLNHLAMGLMVVEAPSGEVFMLNQKAEEFVVDFAQADLHAVVVEGTGAEHLDGTPYAPGETPVARALRGEFVMQEELVRRDRQGNPAPFSVNASPVKDSEGRVVYAVATFEDISERRAREQALHDKEDELSRLNARLLFDALHDTLTGLPNRALLLDRLEQVLQRRLAEPSRDAGLLFIDFDRFKLVNDSLGHSVGDAMLIKISETLSKIIRPEDTVARLGGDEFVILMDHLDSPDRAIDLADRIRKAFTEPLMVGERIIFTSASIGIVPSLVGYKDPDEVLRDADTAMYAAKEAGRARYRVFDQRMRHEVLAALELENDLWRAYALQEFVAHYSPIHRLEDGQVVGLEALVRWDHPSRGVLKPKEFLATATEMGIGRDIDEAVWRQACRAVNGWRDRYGESLLLLLHFNPRHFLSFQPEQALIKVFEDENTAMLHSAISLGEGALSDASDVAESAILKIVSKGISLHIDDFGSGHHSLYNMQRYNVGTIKIDENLVTRLPDDPKSIELVRAMVAMATSLKIAVTAKGVRTRAQHEMLLELGCTYGQGPYYSAPLPEAAVPQLLELGE